MTTLPQCWLVIYRFPLGVGRLGRFEATHNILW